MTLHNIIISFDKILVDLDPIYLESWKRTIKKLNLPINEKFFNENKNWCFHHILENIINKNQKEINLKEVYETQEKYLLEAIKSANYKQFLSENILKILKNAKKDAIKIYLVDCNFYVSKLIEALGCKKLFDYIIYQDQNIDNSLSYQEISLINPINWLLKLKPIIPQNTIALSADQNFIKSLLANHVYTVSIGNDTINESNFHFNIVEEVDFDQVLFNYYQASEE